MLSYGLPTADTPFLNADTGLVSEAWYIFLLNLFQSASSGSVGGVNQVLHGGGAGYGAVSLTADISGRLTALNFVRGGLGTVFMGQGAATDSDYRTVSGDISMLSSGYVTVSQINGSLLGVTTPAAGNLLVGQGASWLTKAMSGDATMVSTGAITVSKTNGANFTSYATAVVGQLLGTATNDSANAGNIGEVISSMITSAAPVTATNGVAVDITSITVTAGDWDIWGNFSLVTVGANPIVAISWLSTTSATVPDQSLYAGIQASATTVALATGTGFDAPAQVFKFAGNTIVYLSSFCANTVGNSTVCGNIFARRRR